MVVSVKQNLHKILHSEFKNILHIFNNMKYSLILLSLLFTSLSFGQCAIDAYITANPPPINGEYGPGETIEFCVQIDNCVQVNINWIHSVIIYSGWQNSGWEPNSLSPSGHPASCSGTGQWIWESTIDAWAYDTSLNQQPPGPPDGNPWNNWGDNFSGTSCTEYCFTLTTRNDFDCIQGADLFVGAAINSDSETGNWSNPACFEDEADPFFATLSCCAPPNLIVNTNSPVCEGTALVLSASTQYNGPEVPTYTINGPGFSYSGTEGLQVISNPQDGFYDISIEIDNCLSAETILCETVENENFIMESPITVCSGENFEVCLEGNLPSSGIWQIAGASIIDYSESNRCVTVASSYSQSSYPISISHSLSSDNCSQQTGSTDITTVPVPLPPEISEYGTFCFGDEDMPTLLMAENPNSNLNNTRILWYANGDLDNVIYAGETGIAQDSVIYSEASTYFGNTLKSIIGNQFIVQAVCENVLTGCRSELTTVPLNIEICPSAQVNLSTPNPVSYCGVSEDMSDSSFWSFDYLHADHVNPDDIEIKYQITHQAEIFEFYETSNHCSDVYVSSYNCLTYVRFVQAYLIYYPQQFDEMLSSVNNSFIYDRLGSIEVTVYPDITDLNLELENELGCCPIFAFSNPFCNNSEAMEITNSIDQNNDQNPDCSNINDNGNIIFTVSNTEYPFVPGDLEYQDECAFGEYSVPYNCFEGNTNRLNLKIDLEGRGNANTLPVNLNNDVLLPTNQPFDSSPYFYEGNEQIADSFGDIVDWIYLELRPSIDLNLVIDKRAALLRSDGVIIDSNGLEGVTFPYAVDGEDYHIAIFPRGHLAFVSSFFFEWPFVGTFDFTVTDILALGSEQLKLVNGKYAAYAGDFNADGIINTLDFNLWFQDSAATNIYASYDADLNGVINVNDFTLWFENRSKVGVSEIMF